MRLDFNIAVIDDDFAIESNRCRAINELLDVLKKWIKQKGFEPILFKSISMEKCLQDESIDGNKHHNRIDLYLSDNNLGGESQDGIDLYLQLKDKLICDFILYTRSDIKEILTKITNDLNQKQDPNLFSRFTFVSRPNDPEDSGWHEPIRKVINHIISSREEINHLRGLFAQVTAKIHHQMKIKLNKSRIDFEAAIEECYSEGIIDEDLRKLLTTQRLIRNDIIHNNEYYDRKMKTFMIDSKDYKVNKFKSKSYCYQNFPTLRKDLLLAKDKFFEQLK